MKSIYAILVTILTSFAVNAMSFMQAPPPPPPDPTGSGGIGGNNVPIDQIVVFLMITFITFVLLYAYKRKKITS